MNYAMLREIVLARRKSFGLLAFLVLADLALVLFVSLWQEPALERTQSDWFAKRDAAARGVDRGVTARYREGERDLEQFQQRLISKKDFAGLLSELFAIAGSHSLTLKTITYKPPQVKDLVLPSYGVTFNVTGKYAGVKSFLGDLARLPKMVTLDSVSLTNSSAVEESVDLKVQLTVFLKTEGA